MAKKGISRRTFLKGTGAVVAGAALGGKFATQGIFKPNVVHAQKEVVLAIQEFAFDGIKAVLPDFEKSTGLTVTFEAGPASGTDMLTKYSTAFAAGSSPVDVFSDADESSPVFMRAGWIEPLTDIIPQETWDDYPEVMASQIELFHSFDGVRYRIPHEFAVGYFWTRSDWFAEKGVKSPTTWDEEVQIGKEFTDANTGVWGTTDGIQKGGLLYVYCAYLAAQSGGSIFDFDDATATAFQFLYDLIYTHKIMPEAALNQEYTAQNNAYTGDKIAFMRQWPYFESVAEGVTDWYKPEKVKIEVPPAGPGGAKSWWGGWGFSIPKYAPNMDGAKELLKYLTSNDVFPQLGVGQSWFIIPRTSVLNFWQGKNNPMVNAMGTYIDQKVLSPRPYHAQVSNAQTVVEDMVSLFLSGQAKLTDVMKQGKEQIAALSTQ